MLTRNEFGVGWYLGTRLDPEAMRKVMDEVTSGARIEPVLSGLPRDVQAARRGDYLITNEVSVQVRPS